MRKIFWLVMVVMFLLGSLSAQSTLTVTGVVYDPGGNLATSGFVEFDISPQNSGVQYYVQGLGTISPQSVQCPISGVGTISCQIWGNDRITPANTCYTVTIAPNGVAQNSTLQQITGTSYDIDSPAFCPVINITPQQQTYTGAQVQANITPLAPHVFTLGTANFPFGSLYVDSIFATNFPNLFNASHVWGPQTFKGLQLFNQPPVGLNNYGGLTCFGDSITAGFNATNPVTGGYCALMGADFGGVTTNYGVSGDQAADTARLKVYPNTNPNVQHNPSYTVLIGTNDANHMGLVPNYEMIYQQTLAASVAWLTIPRTQKLFGQDATATKTGTWTNDNTIVSGLGVKSTTNGDSVSFTLTTGTALYVGYRIIDGNGGTAQVKIDGVLATDAISGSTTLSAFGFGGQAILTQNGTTDSIALARYVLTAGSHTVSVTVTSTTGAGNIFSFLWAGTPASSVSALGYPRAFVGGVIRQQNDALSSTTATYDGFVQNIVASLAGDGLYAFYIPTRNYVNATTDMFNLLHPNDVGHLHLTNAFEFVAQPTASLSNTSLLAVAAPAPISSSNYSNFNTAGLHSTTALNPGWINYIDASNVFGYQLGFVTPFLGVAANSANMIFSGSLTIPFAICTHPTGTLPTVQSSFTCPYFFLANGMPQFAPAAAPATVKSYFTPNAKGLHSTTALNPGVSLYDDGTNAFGMDLGWVTTPSGVSLFANRIYSSNSAVNAATAGFCQHASGTDPTGQTSFTCPAGVLSNGVIWAAGYQVGNVPLAASHLSNGVTGSGAVVLATSPALITPTIGGGGTITKVLPTFGTITFTAIAAQTCQEQGLLNTGTTANSATMASPSTDLGNFNLTWSSRPVPNNITIRVCNPTAGSITPNAVRWNGVSIE